MTKLTKNKVFFSFSTNIETSAKSGLWKQLKPVEEGKNVKLYFGGDLHDVCTWCVATVSTGRK